MNTARGHGYTCFGVEEVYRLFFETESLDSVIVSCYVRSTYADTVTGLRPC